MFQNREEAGNLLSENLKGLIENALVLAIPRGGVVVGEVISKNLKLPLGVLIVKKIGAPNNLELAIGAIASKGVVYWDPVLCSKLAVTEKQKEELKKEKEKELQKRERKIGKKQEDVKGKTVILVDDGVATGATVLAAYLYLKKEKAKKIILASPVIAEEVLNKLQNKFDKVIVLITPENFYAVGEFYISFPQVEDEEVIIGA